jgi:hypothetical protein
MHPFSFTLDHLKYELSASGKVQCSGSWDPDSSALFMAQKMRCFPRKSICFRGHFFYVSALSRSDGSHSYGVIESILIPSSVQVIDRACFEGRNPFDMYLFLDLVVFEPGAGVTDLKESAFAHCISLKCICLPASVQNIFRFCFRGCMTLAHFGFEPGSNLTTIDDAAFESCTKLKSIIIPASVSVLSGRAFVSSGITNISGLSMEYGNGNLKIWGDCIVDINGVVLVTYFGSESKEILTGESEVLNSHFCNDTALVNARFEAGSKVRRILPDAFLECQSLQSIVIPASVTNLSGNAFCGCPKLNRISVQAGNLHLGVVGPFLLDYSGRSLIRYFGSDSSVLVPRQIEVLCSSCFTRCEIGELRFERESLVQEFGMWAFTKCSSLKAIVIPASVTKIAGSAFAGSGICRIEFASDSGSFRTAGAFLLDSRGGLVRYFGTESTVTIERSIVALRWYCFSGCPNLHKLSFESGSALTELEEVVFGAVPDLELVDLPPSLVNVHGSAFVAAKIAQISVDPTNQCLRVIGDFLVDITRARLISCFGSSSSITLSRSVEIIGSYCFSDCESLASLAFERGSKLTRIGRNAFQRCSSLKSIVIPASVTTIGGAAFADCGIRSISIEDGNRHFCVSGQFLLDITKTSLVAFFGRAARVTVGREIEVLCDSCFFSCKTLSRVNFESGSQLRRIEHLAFGECSSLLTIRIPSSIEALERQWFIQSHFYGGIIFDTVEFESAESLAKMVIADCADLSGGFDIEVLNWTHEARIPGYAVETIISQNSARLRKSPLA